MDKKSVCPNIEQRAHVLRVTEFQMCVQTIAWIFVFNNANPIWCGTTDRNREKNQYAQTLNKVHLRVTSKESVSGVLRQLSGCFICNTNPIRYGSTDRNKDKKLVSLKSNNVHLKVTSKESFRYGGCVQTIIQWTLLMQCQPNQMYMDKKLVNPNVEQSAP